MILLIRSIRRHEHHSMPCVSSPESLAVAGYQMQNFVSARDEGNSRNEARWLHRVQLSPCRWSNRRTLYAIVGGSFSTAMIRGDHTGTCQSASMLNDRTDPRGERTHVPCRCDINELLRNQECCVVPAEQTPTDVASSKGRGIACTKLCI